MNRNSLAAVILCLCVIPHAKTATAAEPIEPSQSERQFESLRSQPWTVVFEDSCTGDWTQHWRLDGLKAKIDNGPDGMTFRAGPEWKDDASHAVLWTKDSFQGDIRVDYEYTKLDDRIEAVNILYLLATGSGAEGFEKDIFKWSDQRQVPAMRQYFNHMNLLHISYAAFGVPNSDPRDDYIRARRYLPQADDGLRGTELSPDHLRTGLFDKGVPHQITVIKVGDDLFMHISNHEKKLLCHWRTDGLPDVVEGRIGLRHMWTRAARYRDFQVSELASSQSQRQ